MRKEGQEVVLRYGGEDVERGAAATATTAAAAAAPEEIVIKQMRESTTTAFRGAASFVVVDDDDGDDEEGGASRRRVCIGSGRSVGTRGSYSVGGSNGSVLSSSSSARSSNRPRAPEKRAVVDVGEIARARLENQRKRDADSKKLVWRTGGLPSSFAVSKTSSTLAEERKEEIVASRGTGDGDGNNNDNNESNGNYNSNDHARALVDSLSANRVTAKNAIQNNNTRVAVAVVSNQPNDNEDALERMEGGGGGGGGDTTKNGEWTDPSSADKDNKRSKILSYRNVKYDYYDFSTGTEYEGRTAMRCCVALFALSCIVFGCILVFFVFEYEMPEAD